MKYLLTFFLITAFLSCQQHNYKTFVVKGNIKNASKNKIILLSFGSSNNAIILDTTTIDTKGNFSLKSLSNDNELYVLQIGNSNQIWLVNDNAEIDVNADVNAFKKYSINGSKASNDLHNFIGIIDSISTQIQTTKSNCDSLIQKKVSDSLQVDIKQSEKKLKKYLKNYFTTTYSSTINPALQYFYLYYALKLNILDATEVNNLLVLACQKNPNHSQLNGFKNFLAAHMKSDYKLCLIGDTLPDFSYIDIDSNKISLKTFANKYLIINFWQSKTMDCVKENDRIKKYLEKYQSKNISALNISFDSSYTMWYKAVKRDSLQWKQVRDTMFLNSILLKYLHITNYPTSVLISPQKRIIAVDLRAEKLKDKLEDLFD